MVILHHYIFFQSLFNSWFIQFLVIIQQFIKSRRENFAICHLHTTGFSAPLVPPRTSRCVIQIGEICGFDAAELSEKSVEIMRKFSEHGTIGEICGDYEEVLRAVRSLLGNLLMC
ncbi:hypothetical protein YC2023_045251 [Brassica napus]